MPRELGPVFARGNPLFAMLAAEIVEHRGTQDRVQTGLVPLALALEPHQDIKVDPSSDGGFFHSVILHDFIQGPTVEANRVGKIRIGPFGDLTGIDIGIS